MTTANEETVGMGDFDVEEEEEGPPPKAAATAPNYTAPEGYETIGSSVAGYWDPDQAEGSGPIEFRMSGCRLIDNGKEKVKSSCLILAELVKPCPLIVNSPKKEEQVLQEFPAGTIVGIWAKAGMRDLQHLQGANVWMAPNGFQTMKDADKNAMALFKISRDPRFAKGTTLQLIEDARKESLTEAAKTKNPPWHLICLGEDYGREKAKKLLLAELGAN